MGEKPEISWSSLSFTEISEIISNKNLHQPDIQGDVLKLKHLFKKRSTSQGHLSFYPISADPGRRKGERVRAERSTTTTRTRTRTRITTTTATATATTTTQPSGPWCIPVRQGRVFVGKAAAFWGVSCSRAQQQLFEGSAAVAAAAAPVENF